LTIAMALGVAGALSARAAVANGRYPASTAIALSTNVADPDLVVVRTTYGLLVSRDGGGSWRWLCESALGVPAVSVEDPSVALTASDALVVGHTGGLEISHDDGCDFACVEGPLARQPIVDLAVRADDPHAVVALASSYVFGDAGPAYDTRVWQSLDDGASWAQLGVPLDPAVAVTTIDVAPTDPGRLYVSGTRGYGSSRSASLFVSANGGASWAERPLPFDAATEVQVFIGAIDPASADRVYLRSSGLSRLFVSSDAGRSFQIPLTLTGPMLGFAIAPDGSEVYAGSEEDGLFAAAIEGAAVAATDGGLAFHKLSSIHVQCLATRGTDLWACSDAESGFAIGVSNAGGPFVPKLRDAELAGPIACDEDPPGTLACGADASAAQCSGAFSALCATLDGCSEQSAGDAASSVHPDAGTSLSDAATIAEASPAQRTPACGCSTTAGHDASAGVAAGAIAIAVARRGRRRSDTRAPAPGARRRHRRRAQARHAR
jgi:MYXO-CTERM domain-containing protein